MKSLDEPIQIVFSCFLSWAPYCSVEWNGKCNENWECNYQSCEELPWDQPSFTLPMVRCLSFCLLFNDLHALEGCIEFDTTQYTTYVAYVKCETFLSLLICLVTKLRINGVSIAQLSIPCISGAQGWLVKPENMFIKASFDYFTNYKARISWLYTFTTVAIGISAVFQSDKICILSYLVISGN